MNGLGLSKGAYRIIQRDGKVTEGFNPLPPSVLLVERAALVEHMIAELERLEPDRLGLRPCSTANMCRKGPINLPLLAWQLNHRTWMIHHGINE